MKNGTMYAARLKKAYAKIRPTVVKPDTPEPDDPIRRLATAILGVASGDPEGRQAVERLLSVMVDWNEVRVSTPLEVFRALGSGESVSLKQCQQLIMALRSIYQLEHRPLLDRLKALGRREARQYLEKLPGMDEYAVASVVLWSLGGHAIPISDPVLESLREQNLVDPSASRAEVQAFLERNVSAVEAKEFCLVMNAYADGRPTATARAKGSVGSRTPRMKAAEG
jgi:hypothetical protein